MRPLFLILSPPLVIFVVFLLIVSFAGPDYRPVANPGTYQVIQPAASQGIPPVKMNELRELIESKRADDAPVRISFGNNVEVLIPSRKTIESPGFEPMPEFVKMRE